ncbi:hypothetical protein [Anaerocolumna jejuensis]|uniref:hypothetical protein n=1 Tax=Anaerocolumna jejuensis TaxID=259063 RepID=UPI003F7BCCD6
MKLTYMVFEEKTVYRQSNGFWGTSLPFHPFVRSLYKPARKRRAFFMPKNSIHTI